MIAFPAGANADTALPADTNAAPPRASAAAPPATGTLNFSGSTLGMAFQGVVLSPPSASNVIVSDLKYQWFADGQPAVSGASTDYVPTGGFVPTEATVGKQLSVITTGVDKFGNPVTYTSNSMLVVNVNDAPLGSVNIDAHASAPGTTLHATSTITDADGMGPLTYMWSIDGKHYADTGTASWTPPSFADGMAITVSVYYFDGHGHVEQVGNTPAPLPHVNQPGWTTITGTVGAGQTLRADVHDGDGIDQVFYQWQVSDTGLTWTNVAGGTARSLTLGSSAPAVVRVLTNYTDNFGGVGSNAPILTTDHADTMRFPNDFTLFSAGGNDTLYYAGGANYWDGGAGLDTFIAPLDRESMMLSGDAASHSWALSTYTGQGTTLINVERINLIGVSVALDTDGVAGQAYRLYQAAFDRTPDNVGIGFWISRMDAGVSETAVANAFVSSPEFAALYGSHPSNADVVTQFYQNILHRAPEPGGFAFWVDTLDRHALTVADVLVSFSDSAENTAALVGVMKNGIPYIPYG